jgi:hypothetical protein
MGLMDRFKTQATELAQKTQDTAKAKLDEAQAKRRGDALLRSLGAAVYAERTGRGTADTKTQIDKLVADISAHESETGANLAAPPADSAPDTTSQV